jgi:exopolysaccharide biosynthesis polyprenyl glycosylphosphotransferase
MPKPIEKALLLLVDFLTINFAFIGLLGLRSSVSLFVEQNFLFCFKISVLIYLFWFCLFAFFNLYQSWYLKSRLDEVFAVIKAVSFGIFLIFVFTFEPEKDFSQIPSLGRVMVLSYWFLLMLLVGVGRLALHTVQRVLLERGIGLRNTLIIGWNEKSLELVKKIEQYPALGYKVIGFVMTDEKEKKLSDTAIKLLGKLSDLDRLVSMFKIEVVILSLGKVKEKKVLSVLAQCENQPVHIKIEPDLYSILLGQARTNQIYGFPLMEIQPQLMSAWERSVKRFMDIIVSLILLLIFLPILLITTILIKFESAGPVFYKQKRVGRRGRIFTIYKFRSMIKDAERMTGPIWADKKDPRVTKVGRIIRKLRIDEFPQLINVLQGHMSLVGPRPERPFFVDRLKREYPFYTRRLKVKPGITGWAQVKGKYDTTIEEAKEKLEYDLYYIENISVQLDIKILLFTIYVMLRFKGQ